MDQKIKIGLLKKYSDEMNAKLNELLVDYNVYYQNLRGLHWNVKGLHFFGLHAKFEELYTRAAEVIDEIAERILTLEGQPLHTLNDYVEKSNIKVVANVTDAKQAVEAVIDNVLYLLEKERELLAVADAYNDEGTTTLLSDVVVEQEKLIWMLNSTLK